MNTYPRVRPQTHEKLGKRKYAATPAATASAMHGNNVSLATTPLSRRNCPGFSSKPPLINITVSAASLCKTKQKHISILYEQLKSMF